VGTPASQAEERSNLSLPCPTRSASTVTFVLQNKFVFKYEEVQITKREGKGRQRIEEF